MQPGHVQLGGKIEAGALLEIRLPVVQGLQRAPVEQRILLPGIVAQDIGCGIGPRKLVGRGRLLRMDRRWHGHSQ